MALGLQAQLLQWLGVIAVDLDIPPPRLMLYPFAPTHFDHERYCVVINPHQIMAHGAELEVILAHEMRHAYQCSTGMLQPCEDDWNYTLWHGEKMWCVPRTREEYHSFPWEQDAIAYEKEFADRYNFRYVAP